MERTALQKALYEIIQVRKDLQALYDYLPTHEVVSCICECWRVEKQLRFLLNYDATMAKRRVEKSRRAEMDATRTSQEVHEVYVKYRHLGNYKRSY